MQVDVGVGYSWWMESNERDGLSIAPSTHIDYFFNLGDVRISLANVTSTSVSAADRYEYAGGDGSGGNQDLAFNQLSNSTSVGALWAVNRVMSVGGRYGFSLSRSLNDQFQQLDSSTHSFSVTPNWQVTAPLSLGLYADYSMTTYEERVQNDGQSVSAGASAGWQPMDSLTFTLQAGWQHSFYDRTGTVQDDSEFNGPTFSLLVEHRINKIMTHRLSSFGGGQFGLPVQLHRFEQPCVPIDGPVPPIEPGAEFQLREVFPVR